MGELKDLIQIGNKTERKRLKDPEKIIEIDVSALENKLSKYQEYIEKIDIYRDEADLKIELTPEKFVNVQINYLEPTSLLEQ